MAFIKINNSYLDKNYGLTAKQLYVISYLKYVIQGRDNFHFRMNDFILFVSSSNMKVKYSNKKEESNILRLKDKRSLSTVLDELVDLKLLEVFGDISFKQSRVTDLINIKLKDREFEDLHFEGISDLFMQDWFANLGYNGFMVYCFIKKNYMIERGCCDYSLIDIQKYTGIDCKTTHTYVKLLESLNLLSVKTFQDYNKQVTVINKYKKENEGFYLKSNEYKVPAKYNSKDKYYISYSASQ